MAYICKECKGRGWQVDLNTRQQIPCPHCQPKNDKFNVTPDNIGTATKKETKKDSDKKD